MSAIHWLIAANAAFWAGTGLYLIRLAHIQKQLEQRLRQWENSHD